MDNDIFFCFSAEIRKQRLVEKYNDLKVCILEHLYVAPSFYHHCVMPYCLSFPLILSIHHFQSSGNLESYIEKKRKRNAAKDHRFMPYRRSGDNVE